MTDSDPVSRARGVTNLSSGLSPIGVTEDLDFVLWTARTADPALRPGPSLPVLEDQLGSPGAEARWRAAVESELSSRAGLDRDGLLNHALALLEQGRLVAESTAPPAGFDPRHPAGNALEDLGNLTDLVETLGSEDEHDEDLETEPPRPTWIEIEVVDGLGQPVRNRPYRLHLPDGTVRDGTLDDTGIIRFDDVDPGACRLELPTEDASEWDPLSPANEPGAVQETA